MSDYVTARLVKKATSDGLIEFNDDVPIGRKYRIRPESVHLAGFLHDTGIKHEKEIVFTAGGEWMPVECLEWEE